MVQYAVASLRAPLTGLSVQEVGIGRDELRCVEQGFADPPGEVALALLTNFQSAYTAAACTCCPPLNYYRICCTVGTWSGTLNVR